ncbi:MAG: M14 family metallopeptidase [Bdellovibrionota bacterium]
MKQSKNFRLLMGMALGLICISNAAKSAEARSYDDVLKYMQTIVAEHPLDSALFDLGKNDDGTMIQGIKIGDGDVHTLVVATHHGNEYGSTEVAKAVAKEIAANPIKDLTVYVVPVLNIGGYNKGRRWEVVGGRYFDPNRDYPGPCGTEGPFNLKSTAALAEFIVSENIVTSATLHTYYPVVAWPWGLSSNDLTTHYDDIWAELAKTAAEYSEYPVGNSTEMIYAADGTFEDYAFWKQGIWSLLFELGYSHSPSQTEINKMIETNVPGIRNFLAKAPQERAEKHEFEGQCATDKSGFALDRHDE